MAFIILIPRLFFCIRKYCEKFGGFQIRQTFVIFIWVIFSLRKIKMIKKGNFYVRIAFLLTFFYVQGVMAAGEAEYVLETNITSLTPVYMSGHEGDPNWIEGFNITGDISLDGDSIGTTSGQITLLNPPLNPTNQYDSAILKYVNSLPGIGTYEVTAQAIALGSSTNPTAGDLTVSWSGSISNGTDTLLNFYGLSVGIGVANNFTGEGTLKEVIRVRKGF